MTSHSLTGKFNKTIDTLINHRVYRDFDESYIINDNHINAILAAAQQAPSWMNGQPYGFINITNADLREKIAALQPNNPQILNASHFFIVIADGYKGYLCAKHQGDNFSHISDPDTLITLVTDAALAAQNAAVAAESLGYGTCPIGGIRKVSGEIIKLLELPKYTMPLFGLCIGKPSVTMRLKPRLPRSAVVFNNTYQTTVLNQQLADYEKIMEDFGEKREKYPFREKISYYYSHEYVADQADFWTEQGFLPHININAKNTR